MSSKLNFDKYYTPPITAKWCIEKAYEVIGKENISEVVEPSAGGGSFSHQIEGCKAYDLFPQHESIEKADFTELDLGGYKEGRLFIGNPPFGGKYKTLLNQFYDKCVEVGDYIAWLLPPKHYNNYNGFDRFEIVYQTMIEVEYSNRKLKTAFIIYKRNPVIDKFKNEKYVSDVFDLEVYLRARGKIKEIKPYDYCFNTWGKLLQPARPYEKARTVAIKIHKDEYRDKIINYLRWLYEYNQETQILEKESISSGSISSVRPIKKLIWIQWPEIFQEPIGK